MNEVLFTQDITLLDFIIRLVALGWTIPFMLFFLIRECIGFVRKIINALKENEDGDDKQS